MRIFDFRFSIFDLRPVFGSAFIVVLSLALCGCVSSSTAKARERAAFLAGQQEAILRLQGARDPSINVSGLVKNPVVPWADGMTLSKAIVAAQYYGQNDPQQIVIVRNGQATQLDPKTLLSGEDFPLQPGDRIELR